MFKIIVDGLSIVPERLSGVGHVTLETIRALDSSASVSNGDVKLVVFVPLGKKAFLYRHNFVNVSYREICMPAKLLALMSVSPLPMPLEFFLGRGLFVFPNYRNFATPFSKSITYIHDVCFILHPEFVQPKNRRYLVRNIQRWVRRTTYIATVSESSKNEIMQTLNVEPEKVMVLRNGVEINVFTHYSQAESSRVLRKYKIRKKFILALGNLEPRKNLVNVIKSFQSIDRALRDQYCLVMIGGDGWLDASIHIAIEAARADGADIIRPAQYVTDDDLPVIISGATALVQASVHEGFGLTILQALASQTPIVASDLGVFKEIAADVPEYVDGGSVVSIREGILRIIEGNISSSLLKQGRQLASEFDWKLNADALLILAQKG